MRMNAPVALVVRSVLMVCLLIFGACVSPGARLESFSDGWIGDSLDNFVRANGIPANQYELNDGSKISTFSFGEASVGIPATTTVTQTSPTNTYATTTGGGTVDVGCVLGVHSDQGGTITLIKIERDTIGMWVSSRCYEVLKPN